MKVKGIVTKTNYILVEVLLVSFNIIIHLLHKLYPPAHMLGEAVFILSLAVVFAAMMRMGLYYGEYTKRRALKRQGQYSN